MKKNATENPELAARQKFVKSLNYGEGMMQSAQKEIRIRKILFIVHLVMSVVFICGLSGLIWIWDEDFSASGKILYAVIVVESGLAGFYLPRWRKVKPLFYIYLVEDTISEQGVYKILVRDRHHGKPTKGAIIYSNFPRIDNERGYYKGRGISIHESFDLDYPYFITLTKKPQDEYCIDEEHFVGLIPKEAVPAMRIWSKWSALYTWDIIERTYMCNGESRHGFFFELCLY